MRSVLVIALVVAPAVAFAQQDFPGVRALGMGEAQRATATGGEALMLNPANMSLVKQYVIEAMYGFNVENLGHDVHVSIVDSITARVAAGLFYDFVYGEPKVGFSWAGGLVNSERLNRTGHVAGLALSMALGDHFLLGFTTKYLHIDTTAALPKGTSPKQLTLDSVNGVTWDLGLTVRLGDKFNISAVGYNLWQHGREAPGELGIGLAYVPLPTLSINFDTVVDFTGYQKRNVDPSTDKVTLSNRVSARLGPGIEWTIGNKVPVRAGYIYDSGLYGHFLTLGLGYVSPSFGVDLGYRVKVGGGLENLLMVGLRIFVS